MPIADSLQPRVLIVEDNWSIATETEDALRGAGFDVLGPVGTVAQALALIASAGQTIGMAVLDINLGGERVTPVADALGRLGVPILYATGYMPAEGAEAREGADWFVKPLDLNALIRVLRTMAPEGRGFHGSAGHPSAPSISAHDRRCASPASIPSA